ncbi:Uncharacterized protein SCF082_LOCUS21764, partial [Durusdinium trenchii]
MNVKVVIIGTAGLYVDNDDMDPVTDPAVIAPLDLFASSREEEDSFACYIDSPLLRPIELQGGFITFRYNSDENQLYVVTEYDSPRRLTRSELDALIQYTTDQWSDGLGESLECPYVSENHLCLDLAPECQT